MHPSAGLSHELLLLVSHQPQHNVLHNNTMQVVLAAPPEVLQHKDARFSGFYTGGFSHATVCLQLTHDPFGSH